MREHLTPWDYVPEFTGQQAALAIVGLPPTDTDAPKAAPVLALMYRDYADVIEWFTEGPVRWEMAAAENELVKSPPVHHRITAPSTPLPSIELQRALASIDAATSDMERSIIHRSWMGWLCTNASDFDRQHFSRAVLARWVQQVGASTQYQFAKPPPQESAKAVAPEAQSIASLPAVVSDSNCAPQDPERRLARLRSLGGHATYKRGEWKFTGITALVKAEKSEERKRSDEKTIRDDLREAAQNELDAKRAGVFDRLGQR
ncbi:hypothetical protein [Limnohabitans sp. Hippo3]|uniref:hypothetical protein n=1 Tax=Limnohabitans sp. Hippo3 TaxID=1597956 RepID=UPI000D3B4C30|nr:hypothetical protein [Limnohabitans sp. Hippo3]PUE39187.1 hypothetical protein B9Z34_09485 [Limnohabitans sp. Hippo3]